MDNHGLRPEVIDAKKGLVGTSTRYSTTLQQKMMYVAIPLKRGKKIAAVIRTSLPVTAIDKELKSIQIKIGFGGLLIAFLAAGLSLYVSRRISRPIEEMKKGADYFAGGDLSHKLPDTDLIELSSLAETLNQMAAQLDDRINTIINQRNELEAVLSSMEEGVIALDVDERIISINQAATRIFGSVPDDFLNRTVQEVIRNPKLQEFVREALSTSKNIEKDIILYNENERIILSCRGSMPVLSSSCDSIVRTVWIANKQVPPGGQLDNWGFLFNERMHFSDNLSNHYTVKMRDMPRILYYISKNGIGNNIGQGLLVFTGREGDVQLIILRLSLPVRLHCPVQVQP